MSVYFLSSYVHPSVRRSVCRYFCIYAVISLSVCLSVFCLPICLSACYVNRTCFNRTSYVPAGSGGSVLLATSGLDAVGDRSNKLAL